MRIGPRSNPSGFGVDPSISTICQCCIDLAGYWQLDRVASHYFPLTCLQPCGELFRLYLANWNIFISFFMDLVIATVNFDVSYFLIVLITINHYFVLLNITTFPRVTVINVLVQNIAGTNKSVQSLFFRT